MPILEPVVSRVAADIVAFDLWPVTTSDTGWLSLHGGMTSAEIGMAVWSLLFHSPPTRDDLIVPETPEAAFRLLAGFDTLYAPGGLLLSDPMTGVVIEPGCCCDLFEWRDWLGALRGEPIDLGHSPGPEVEYRGQVLRVWTDGGDGAPPSPDRKYVDVDRAALPELLQTAQRDLIDLLRVAQGWANEIAPGQGAGLAAALDAGLQISEPLAL
ncbi:hypothetical protein ACFO0M_20220 [Micromonospora mangrovi]|uniref:Uncharacterized protein n=2 Tax=Micromonospora TaxID=1873 RepID=A0AAU8H9D8_9ACTN